MAALTAHAVPTPEEITSFLKILEKRLDKLSQLFLDVSDKSEKVQWHVLKVLVREFVYTNAFQELFQSQRIIELADRVSYVLYGFITAAKFNKSIHESSWSVSISFREVSRSDLFAGFSDPRSAHIHAVAPFWETRYSACFAENLERS